MALLRKLRPHAASRQANENATLALAPRTDLRFAGIIDATGSTFNSYLYRGERFDADLGVYYLRARYYNPSNGRFLARDSGTGQIQSPATMHRFLYAEADPVNRIDPSGRQTTTGWGTAVLDLEALAAEALGRAAALEPVAVVSLGVGSLGAPIAKPLAPFTEYAALLVGISGPFGASFETLVEPTARNIDCIWEETESVLAIGVAVAGGATVSSIVSDPSGCRFKPRSRCGGVWHKHHLIPRTFWDKFPAALGGLLPLLDTPPFVCAARSMSI